MSSEIIAYYRKSFISFWVGFHINFCVEVTSFIVVMLSINVILFIVMVLIVIMSTFVFLQEKGIIENYLVIFCYTSISFYWRLALYLYLAILQVSALVLAFKTRNVKIKVLNDSKEISAIVYITSVIAVYLIVVTIGLSDYNNLLAFFYYGGILLVTTVILSLVYVPKVCLRNVLMCSALKGSEVESLPHKIK